MVSVDTLFCTMDNMKFTDVVAALTRVLSNTSTYIKSCVNTVRAHLP